MAGDAILNIKITSDASQAASGMRQASAGMDGMNKSARNASQSIENVGSKASGTTTGLRDMADGMAMIGFPGLAAGMGVAAVGFETIDGATTLFTTHSKFLAKALGGVSKAMNVLKVSILTNPIFIIAAVVIAIGVAFYLLYTRCEGFRKIVDKVFKFVWALIRTVYNWLRTAFGALFSFLAKPFQLWLSTVRAIFNGAKDFIAGYISFIRNAFSKVADFIIAPFRKAMDWIKSHVKFPSLPSWMPGGKSAPAGAGVFIPQARAGGTATRATTGPTIVIQTGIGDPHEIARQIRRLLREDESRLGRITPTARTWQIG